MRWPEDRMTRGRTLADEIYAMIYTDRQKRSTPLRKKRLDSYQYLDGDSVTGLASVITAAPTTGTGTVSDPIDLLIDSNHQVDVGTGQLELADSITVVDSITVNSSQSDTPSVFKGVVDTALLNIVTATDKSASG